MLEIMAMFEILIFEVITKNGSPYLLDFGVIRILLSIYGYDKNFSTVVKITFEYEKLLVSNVQQK